MKTSHRTWAFVLMVACIVVGLFAIFKQKSDPNALADTRINRIHDFPRASEPRCDEIGAPSKMQLHIRGMDTGLRAVGCQDGMTPTASFWLQREKASPLPADADRAVWAVAILGNPLETVGSFRSLEYDIVLPAEVDKPARHIAPTSHNVSFYIFEWWAPIAIGVVLIVWALLVYLASCSALLRDRSEPGVPLENRTFSLAKTQMAWWFAIIFASFVFLWLVTGTLPSLSGQALALLGISSVTTIASVTVNGGRAAVPGQRGVFFLDLLSDGDGITIQRFQMVVMTVALGLMFLMHVAANLVMPTFDASLLALLGISAGTYVGLKLPAGPDPKLAAPQVPALQDPKSGYTPAP